MPVSIAEASDDLVVQAATKAQQVKSSFLRYVWLSALAGAFVGIAVVLLISVSAPLVATNSPAAKLVQAAVFGIALTLVVFAGAELFTGNAMVMLQGVVARRTRISELVAVWVASLVGNFVGSVGLAAVVHGGGTLSGGPGAALVAAATKAKDAAAGPQLFWRALLCNMLVCLALWMAARTKSDGAKLVVLWWALLAFIGSGFEHSIANMTLFSLGIFEHSATWSMLLRNLAWTVPGNIVGGGVVIGAGYAWLGSVRERSALADEVAAMAALEPEAAVA
ncbi:MAG: nitrite transporter [Actinomycetota bacterium]